MKALWGVRALHTRVFSLPQDSFEPPLTSDCTIVIVSGGLGSSGCDAPSPVLVVTELRELVFQLERPIGKQTGVCVRSLLAFFFFPRVFWSFPVHLIAQP